MRATVFCQHLPQDLFPSPQPSPAGSFFCMEYLLAGEGAKQFSISFRLAHLLEYRHSFSYLFGDTAFSGREEFQWRPIQRQHG